MKSDKDKIYGLTTNFPEKTLLEHKVTEDKR